MRLLPVIAIALALAGCSKNSVSNRGAPDEFAITKSAPLVVPPDYSLTPPKPGQPRPVGQDSQSQAVEALFGPGAKPPPKSQSEQELLDKAGAAKTDQGVRSNAGDQETSTVDKGSFLIELMNARPGSTNAAVANVAIGG